MFSGEKKAPAPPISVGAHKDFLLITRLRRQLFGHKYHLFCFEKRFVEKRGNRELFTLSG